LQVYYLLLHWAERFIYGDGDGGDGDMTADEDDTYASHVYFNIC